MPDHSRGVKHLATNHRRPFIALWFVVFLAWSLPGAAQFYQFRNFNVKDGLPSSEVYGMLQDSKGYMWFATDMGVSWFDGYHFTNFTTENGLTDNTIFGVYEDRNHNIWFQSSLGKLSYFSYTDGKIHTIAANETLTRTIQRDVITSMYIGPKDTIWLGTSSYYLIRVSPGSNAAVDTITLPRKGSYLYQTQSGGQVYGGASGKQLLLNVYTQNQPPYTINTGQSNLSGPGRCIVHRMDDHYLASVNNVVFTFNRDGLISMKHFDDIVISLLADTPHITYVGTYRGIRIFGDYDAESPELFGKLEEKIITSVCRDTENNLWICTKGHGIYCIPHRNLRYFTPDDGLTQSGITCMRRFRNNIVTGHLSGEVSFLNQHGVQTIKPDWGRILPTGWNEITDMWNDRDRYLHIETGNAGFTFLPSTNEFRRSDEKGIKKIIQLRDGHILMLKYRAVLKADSNLQHEKLLVDTIPYYADNLYEDHDGTIWICTINGIYTLNEQHALRYEGNKGNGELAARIVEFAEGAHDALWMATRGEGILVRLNNRYLRIRRSDGLSSNMCRTLYVDGDQHVWVGTNNGLNKITVSSYTPFQYTVETYNAGNGLLTNEVNFIVPREDRLWLAHNNGITVFDPDNIKNDRTPPPIYINKVLINGNLPDSSTRMTALMHNQNDVTIRYIGLSYKNPGQLEYKYMLEGLDSNWTYGTNTSVKYQTLPEGTYRFVVYAMNSDGFLSATPATLEFTIRPAWWNTWTVRLIGMGVIGLLIGLAFRYRLKVIQRQERLRMIRKTRMSVAELKALRAQMNPHFIFNTINSVQYFITGNDPKSSQKYLSKFARLIRYVIDNSKPSLIPLEKELEALNLYLDLESLRFGNRFEYHVIVHEDVDVNHTNIPSMLIQPYVENAIWHGLMHKTEKGKLIIDIRMEQNNLLCVIEDNGIGRQKSAEINVGSRTKQHKSMGMSITKERLDILNEHRKGALSVEIIDLTDAEGFPIGTRVELHIPLS
ncbi:MAG: histidine kinase [Flavobacteriales bacterium]|nr:histidine kinase [Flavobacteriales bacterium]